MQETCYLWEYGLLQLRQYTKSYKHKDMDQAAFSK